MNGGRVFGLNCDSGRKAMNKDDRYTGDDREPHIKKPGAEDSLERASKKSVKRSGAGDLGKSAKRSGAGDPGKSAKRGSNGNTGKASKKHTGGAAAQSTGKRRSGKSSAAARRRKRRRRRQRIAERIILAVAVIVFCVSLVALIRIGLSYKKGTDTYAKIEEAVTADAGGHGGRDQGRGFRGRGDGGYSLY